MHATCNRSAGFSTPPPPPSWPSPPPYMRLAHGSRHICKIYINKKPNDIYHNTQKHSFPTYFCQGLYLRRAPDPNIEIFFSTLVAPRYPPPPNTKKAS